ncbi:thiol-disulfide oxidoreductase DCC family protein [Cellulophaga fucicola]|uniref:Predicted thiol-disulfide oxidoreductase YuxK, DCC family n=1 Tax=Cellulophaga fucicola TaxID=76595 RepID=A0A1K1M0K1_9FLAO|nr:DCC1-like thiol-disulfide oxidoreductase family protein [Cellulophaga fucicola]SFW16658.1 Predicted thiol-disulfide oxidoreductase YuxK, DCC family [Cellulophaga fucicola]
MKQLDLENKKIIFFDGVCNLCNNFIDQIIHKDHKKIIYYSSLQSDITKELLKPFNVEVTDSTLSTIFFYENGKLYKQSTAVLKVYTNLSTGYRILAKILLVIPSFIRNGVYNFIAKNRYRFFGKKETCRLPSQEEKDQFI